MKQEQPHILIAGSGAVGAVFGEHLTRAGAKVRFLVRDPNSLNARMPRTLHQLHLGGQISAIHQMLEVSPAITDPPDQCWLCLPSTALTSDWLIAQLRALPEEVPIINWTPDLKDRTRLESALERSIHMGLIGLVSYQAPLPGETQPPAGIAYWLPPRSAILDNTATGREAATLLRNGGLPASQNGNLPWLAARMTAVVVTLMAALESESWSLDALRRTPSLSTAAAAAREAIQIGGAYHGIRCSYASRLPNTPMYRGLLRGLEWLAPFNLETYLGYHFAKVADQTRLMLDTWIEEGRKHTLSTTHLEQLREQLP